MINELLKAAKVKFKNRLCSKILYSERSHYLLNYITLNIKDAEIKKALFEFRLQGLNRCFAYGLVLTILNMIWCIFQHFTV